MLNFVWFSQLSTKKNTVLKVRFEQVSFKQKNRDFQKNGFNSDSKFLIARNESV